MSRLLLIASFLFALLPPVSAQREYRLTLMSLQRGEITEAEQTWEYGEFDFETSVLVRTLTGTLDPMLELLAENGDIVTDNSDMNTAFGTAARMVVPPGGPYRVRVRASFGTGMYEISAVPGDMQFQWRHTFENPRTDWNFDGAPVANNTIQLTAQRGSRRIFTPDSAPPASDIYVQARLSLLPGPGDEVQAGLMVRGKRENNGLYTAYHFIIAPQNRWALQKTDITGTVTSLQEGSIDTTTTLTLGLLAQGDKIQFFIDGENLGEIADADLAANSAWGISIISGSILLEELWFASAPLEMPDFPRELASWDSVQPDDIVNEIIESGLFPEGGRRRIYVSSDSYQVGRQQQRTFLIGQPADVFSAAIIGLDVTLPPDVDTGCGIIARHSDADNQILAYVDLQGGAGLLWWEDGILKLNDYSMIENQSPGAIKMVLVAYDEYVSLYINGVLTAQAFIPNRVGDVGIGFINYADRDATCTFRNFWVWG